jgi:hypothetical protein
MQQLPAETSTDPISELMRIAGDFNTGHCEFRDLP